MSAVTQQIEANKNLKFEYIQVLCQAVESFTNNLETNDPNVFKHHGANLKYAIERDLYFYGVDNDNLYTFFRQSLQGELPGILEVETQLEADLALHLLEGALEPSRFRLIESKDSQLNFNQRLRKSAIYKWVAQIKKNLEAYALKSQTLLQDGKADVLIYLTHPRFFNFLKPILKGLPLPYKYLVVQNPEIKLCVLGDKPRFHNIEKFYNLLVRRFSDIYVESGKYEERWQEYTYFYDIIYTKLKQVKPKVLMIIEGNLPSNEIINQAAKQLSIPVICLQQGWSPIFHNGFRNMNYSKMFVWGEGFAELLKPYNPQQKFVVTGSHTLNSETRTGQLNQTLSRKAVSFFLQTPHRMISRKSWDDFMQLLKWSAGEFPEVPILVREHPRYSLSQKDKDNLLSFANVKFVPSTKFFLADVLDASFLTVSIYSSTILESVSAGVTPLIFNTTSMPRFCPDIDAAGAGIEVKHLEQAKKVLRQFITDETFSKQFESGIRKFQEKYFYRIHQKPTDNIIEEIISTANYG